MDNVQNYDSYINIPWSQTYKYHLESFTIYAPLSWELIIILLYFVDITRRALDDIYN
jgi:hypothetical protein